jgi:hypothetical protein
MLSEGGHSSSGNTAGDGAAKVLVGGEFSHRGGPEFEDPRSKIPGPVRGPVFGPFPVTLAEPTVTLGALFLEYGAAFEIQIDFPVGVSGVVTTTIDNPNK